MGSGPLQDYLQVKEAQRRYGVHFLAEVSAPHVLHSTCFEPTRSGALCLAGLDCHLAFLQAWLIAIQLLSAIGLKALQHTALLRHAPFFNGMLLSASKWQSACKQATRHGQGNVDNLWFNA